MIDTSDASTTTKETERTVPLPTTTPRTTITTADSNDGSETTTAAAATMTNNNPWQLWSVNPGHVLLLTSLPVCYGAYRDYNKPLDKVVQQLLEKQTGGRVKMDYNIRTAQESVRRAVGSAVASRALGVATRGSLGIFGLCGAMIFYASGASSLSEAVHSTQRWAQSGRKRLFDFLGIHDTFGKDHPDYIATRGMTEEQELEYLSKTYFSIENESSSSSSSSSLEEENNGR